ncbi:MAG: formylglycine-generating enzyme family protein [Phaeodactylibacter sp.]|nr:formylglycine-generating enzyme family protein [Phaeodactylibacter sp.]
MAGEPFLVAHKPFFINLLFEGAARVDKIAPEGECRLKDFISVLDIGLPPEWVEILLLALEKYGLAFRKIEDQETIIIPHLLPKRAPEFGINLHETAYQQTALHFSGFRPATLFNRFTALMGASGAHLRSCTRFGLVLETEQEFVRVLERSGSEWQVVQVQKGNKSGYDKLEGLYRLLDEILKGYYQVFVSLSPAKPLQIPAYATPEMVNVPGGTFTMGWLDEQRDGDGFGDEKPAHEVKLNSFSIGKHQVTFEEYDAFCEATGREKPKDAGWGRGRRPAIYVDWYDAVEYCNWLSEIWGLEQAYRIDKKRKDPNNKYENDPKKWLVTANESTNGYRLLTEAEWEYAARGGQKSEGFLYAGSNELDEVGWYDGNSGSKTHPVGEKQPNELGLYDMSGNVYEWCWDWFAGDYYRSSPEDNPRGPDQGSSRVSRGGRWGYTARNCRAACRYDWSPAYRYDDVGFRLARSLEAAPSYERR